MERESDAHDGDIHLAGMGRAAMLKNKDPLPCPQRHLSPSYGNHLACPGEGHSQMARSVVWTFQGVDIITIFRSDFLEVGMEVRPGAGVSVFINHETGAGMAYENGRGARLDPASPNDLGHFIGDFIGPLAPGRDCDCLVPGDHCGLMATKSQPARNNNPPIGVIAPSQRIFVKARR
jgi:hypothetical protein